MHFIIKGYHPADGVVSIGMDAISIEQARSMAVARNIDVIAIERHWQNRWRLRPRERRFNLLLFSQELHSLLIAGLSVIEALGAVARKEPPSAKRTLIEDLVRQLREGKPLSLALRAHPAKFPALYLALASASEKTGDLPGALERFVAYRIRMDEVKKQLVAALLYPVLLIGVGSLVVVFLMAYVVPRFAAIYEDFGRTLPFMSRLLMSWGTLVASHGGALLAGLTIVIAAAVVLYRRVGLQGLLARIAGLGVVRERVQQYGLSRFYRTVGLLEKGGIPLVEALDMATGLLGVDQRDDLVQAIRNIRSGLACSDALRTANLAPPVALDLLRVGERTGDLGEKMIRIADFYDEEQSRWIDWFARLFEPLLMLAIGVVIALIIVMLYLPIFELAGNIQ
jgi:general secretion pathway protein F